MKLQRQVFARTYARIRTKLGPLVIALTVVVNLGGCGGTAKPKTVVCNVSPGRNGDLVYSPPGCEKHLKP